MQQIHLEQGEHRHLVIHHIAADAAQWCIEQEADSVLTIHLICLDRQPDTVGDVRLNIRQIGEHAETFIYGLGIIRGKQQVSVHTHVEHCVPGGTSTQLLKFAVGDEARAEFLGELIVAPHAQHTHAMQTNRNILLSPAATMHTQPQLEIYADDVKCSHGATTGQLDESALFYMMQRGLNTDTARQLLLAAFFHDVLLTLHEPELVERLQRKIAARLA